MSSNRWSTVAETLIKHLRLPHQGLKPEELPTVEQLRSFFDLYGPSARDAYRFAKKPNDYKRTLAAVINGLTGSAIRKIVGQGELDSIAMKQSHKVFLIQPSPQDDSLPPASSPEDRHEIMSVSVITGHVMDLILEAHDGNIRNDLIRHWQITLQDPAAKAFAGQIFERVAHIVLSDEGEFELVKMTANNMQVNTHWTKSHETQKLELPLRTRFVFPDINALELEKLDPGKYYQPIASNNPTFDSFIYDNNPVRVVTLFQSTVSPKHSANDQGLCDIQQVRGKEQAGAQLRYIVVMPKLQEITITMRRNFYEKLIKEELSFEMWAMVVDVEQQANHLRSKRWSQSMSEQSH